ncbi:unnamed protein product [Heligmosomoides polygyrus]|uniref:Reverse transcriptase domain-containing protein n=1 Tax=Heligmosomoides polygyrus TaxID=6339 RepID=A0A183G5U6_HELPZ|nr:unnamed protein product [Heligmosomoides polygyrus]
MPDDWRDNIVSIFKQKVDASECSNNHGIKLISHAMKVYERLVESRLREMVTISQEQWGLMPERSTIDVIFIARQVMECIGRNESPATWRSWTWRKPTTGYPGLCSRNPFDGEAPHRLISVIKAMYEGSKAAVRTPHGMTKKVYITVGVHQGLALC